MQRVGRAEGASAVFTAGGLGPLTALAQGSRRAAVGRPGPVVEA